MEQLLKKHHFSVENVPTLRIFFILFFFFETFPRQWGHCWKLCNWHTPGAEEQKPFTICCRISHLIFISILDIVEQTQIMAPDFYFSTFSRKSCFCFWWWIFNHKNPIENHPMVTFVWTCLHNSSECSSRNENEEAEWARDLIELG